MRASFLILLLALECSWLAVPAGAQTNLTCLVCGKGSLSGKVWQHKLGYVCDECYQLPTRCSICGLPARVGFTKTSDGRIICQRDAKDALLSPEEAVRLFEGTRTEILRTVGEVMRLRSAEVTVSLFDVDYWNHQGSQPLAEEMRRTGFSQSRRSGDQFNHNVILLSGQPKADVQSVCAHEYTHLWLNENLPPGRSLEPDTLEAVCEIVAYRLAAARGDTTQQEKIRDNLYTHGRIKGMIEAESQYGLKVILDWAKTGKTATFTPEESLRPAAGYALVQQQQAPVPATLHLTGLIVAGQRRLATINGRSFEAGKERLVPVGDKHVRVRCLEIRDDGVVIRVEGSATSQTLALEHK